MWCVRKNRIKIKCELEIKTNLLSVFFIKPWAKTNLSVSDKINIFLCVLCVFYFSYSLSYRCTRRKNWKLKKCVRGERLTRCAHTKFSRGIERDDEGGVNVSNKNKIEIVCETINERYLWAHLRVYIYMIFCVWEEYMRKCLWCFV